MIFSREFAMPNAETFSIPPISRLLDRWLRGIPVIVDPFARNSKLATLTNDLNPDTRAEFHLAAEDFIETIRDHHAGAILFDPPYSPRQISECYQQVGRSCSTADTQNGALYKRCKDGLHRVLADEGIAICCGWNSSGFGISRGYELLELLLVNHGAAHNDTIVTVERKLTTRQTELWHAAALVESTEAEDRS